MKVTNIIDFHQHNVNFKENLNVMEKNKITKALIIPLNFGNLTWHEVLQYIKYPAKSQMYFKQVINRIVEINNKCYQQIQPFKKELIFVPWIIIGVTELHRQIMSQIWYHKAKVVKVIPPFDNLSNNYLFDFRNFLRINQEKVIMIHTGWGTRPIDFEPLINEFIDTQFVLAHMKEDNDLWNEDRIKLLNLYPNVHVETSYESSAKRIYQYIKMGFEDRLLFGSDFRTTDDTPTLETSIYAIQRAVTYYHDSNEQEILDKIFYKNAQKLLGEL